MKKKIKTCKKGVYKECQKAICGHAFLFPRATSQADMLACPFGDCREGQKPRNLLRSF